VNAPVLVVLCGINGAGKSTFADSLAASPDLQTVASLNPDRLSADYRRLEPSLTRDLADIRALRHVAQEIHRLIEARESFVSETVGANIAYRRYVSTAKQTGFFVRVMFVGLRSVEESIARVSKRVTLGGHSIPEADIRRRWPAVHANLAWFAANADLLEVFFNADDGAEPRRVGLVRQGTIEFLDHGALPEVTRALETLPRA